MNQRILDAISSFYKLKNGYPTAESVANKFQISLEEAKECLSVSRINLPETKPLKNMTPSSALPQESYSTNAPLSNIQTGVKSPKNSEKSSKNHFDLHNLLSPQLIQILWTTLAIISAYRSFGYIHAWFARVDTDFNAAVSAILFTATTFILPVTIIIIYKQGRRWIASGLLALFIPVMLFSMTTTVGGIYEAHSIVIGKSQPKESQEAKKNEKLAELKSQIEDAAKSKTLSEAELAQRLEVQKKYEVGSREYNRLANNIAETKDRIDRLERKSQDLANARESLLDTAIIVSKPRATFLDFLDGFFSWQSGTTEFYSSLVIALVLDIVGPVAALIGFFL